MKLLSLWAEATVKPSFVLLALILMVWASDVLAYENYSGGSGKGNCFSCHGDFTADSYNPPFGRPTWGTGNSLHSVHQSMVSDDCDTCHTGVTGEEAPPVFLDSSNGGDGLELISCVGCHGRDQDRGNDGTRSPGRGAGLRQHHIEAGETVCGTCHSDAAGYTPVGENISPNYYANPTTHTAIPLNPCIASGAGGEDVAGSPEGLDNDGNGTYDTADPNCPVPVELMIFEIE